MTDHPDTFRPVTRALLSLSDKTGLVPFAALLAAHGVELLSTGGTAAILREAGLTVVEVADYTGFPEMLDGRVKTLHPRIHGGLLFKRDDAVHREAANAHHIGPIDLLVVTLYPFEQTVASGADDAACIEQIDIGGPAMLRSAAKNHDGVVAISDSADYALVADALTQHRGTTLALRRALAAKVFARTARYDAAIGAWCERAGFSGEKNEIFPANFILTGQLRQRLRYGENPHQRAAFYVTDAAPGVASARQMQGKELSYNNINDTNAAFELVSECTAPAIAIIKHANPCGVAVGATLAEAYAKALACDPASAYGGIIAANRPLDAALVQAIGTLFAEVVIAPDATPEALALLSAKKNLRVLLTGGMTPASQTPASKTPTTKTLDIKSVTGGFLVQERDIAASDRAHLTTLTRAMPSEAEIEDLLFAFLVAKHVKSNAIVLARAGATIGIGAGQMSRVDSVRLACQKAEAAGLATQGAVLASDAFFPFDDNVHQAARAGIIAIIQPGGSIRDAEVVQAADSYGMSMVTTGLRHFRH